MKSYFIRHLEDIRALAGWLPLWLVRHARPKPTTAVDCTPFLSISHFQCEMQLNFGVWEFQLRKCYISNNENQGGTKNRYWKRHSITLRLHSISKDVPSHVSSQSKKGRFCSEPPLFTARFHRPKHLKNKKRYSKWEPVIGRRSRCQTFSLRHTCQINLHFQMRYRWEHLLRKGCSSPSRAGKQTSSSFLCQLHWQFSCSNWEPCHFCCQSSCQNQLTGQQFTSI